MSAEPTRRARRPWVVLATALLCLLAVLALPPTQLAIARAVLRSAGGADSTVGYLWAGPRGIALENLQLTLPGIVARIGRADVDFAFWSSLLHLRVDVERATITGLDVDLSAVERTPKSAPATQEAPPFAGIRNNARLPRWIRLRRLDATGHANVAPDPSVTVAGSWQLAVEGVFAESMSTARFTTMLEARRDQELLAASFIELDASATVAADSRISKAAITASAQPSDGSAAALRAALDAELEQDNERYTFELTGRTGAQLARAEATLTPAAQLDARWRLDLTPGVVAAFARGRSVADLSGSSSGELRADLAAHQVEIRSSTQLQGRGWEAFDPRLASLGTLDFGLELDGSAVPGMLSARTVHAALSSAERGDLLTIATLQPLRFATDSWLVEPERPSEPALRAELHELPLRWVGRLWPAARIEAGQLSGALDIVRDADRASLVVTDAIKATGVMLAPVGDITVPAFDITFQPQATLGGGSLTADIEELTLTSSMGGRITLRGTSVASRATWPRVTFEGEIDASLPRLQATVPDLADIRAAAKASLDTSTMMLGIAEASVGAESKDGRELVGAELRGEQPLEIALPAFTIDWDDYEPQTMSLRLDRMPLAWLSRFMPDIALASGDVSGRFAASASRESGVRLVTDQPLTISSLLPVYRGRTALQSFDATVRPEVHLSNEASSVQLLDLQISSPNGNRLGGQIVVEAPSGRDRLNVSLALDGNLTPLAKRFGAQLGVMTWRQEAELDTATRRLTINNLSFTFADLNGQSFFELDNSRPFFLTSEPLAVGVDGGSREILRAKVTPLRLEGLLPNIFGFDLAGVLPEGEFFGRAEEDGSLTLAATSPLSFRDVSVRWDDATLLDRVTMTVLYEVSYAASGISARSVELSAVGPDGRELLRTQSRVSAPLRGNRVLDSAQIEVHANLAPLADQPVLADLPPFTAGTLEATFDLERAAESTLSFGAQIHSAATEALGALPDLDLRLDASGVQGQHVAVTLPVRLESPAGVSDLALEGNWSRGENGSFDFAAALQGSRIVAEDVEQLLRLLEPRDSGGTGTPTVSVTREERASAIAKLRADRHNVPVWTDHVTGTAKLDIGSIVLPSGPVEGIHGTLALTPQRAALSDLRASFFGAKLEAEATVDFAAAKPKPYSLDFHTAVTDLELQKLFAAIAPGKPPTAEGRFELESTLAGAGLNPLDLALSSLGQIRLRGSDGVFRGLAAQAGTGSKAARVIGILTFSRELKAIGRLLDGLGEIRFSSAEVELARTTPDRIELESLALVAPQLRVEAMGALRVAPQQPLLTSPLDLSAQIAARGDVAVVFDGMGLLERETSGSDYRDLRRRVEITGTAAEPDASSFWDLLDEGATNARGSFGVGLRALNERLEGSAGR